MPILADAAYRLRWPIYADPRLAGICRSLTHVKALTERLVAEALAAIEAADAGPDPGRAELAQEHALIRDTQEYGSLFALATTRAGANTRAGGGQ